MTQCPKNGHVPKIFFRHFFRKLLFSSKKLLDEKIFKTSFPIKKVIFIFVARCPLLSKGTWLPKIVFHSFLGKYSFFLKKKLCQIKGNKFNFRYRFFYLSTSCFIKPFLYVILNTNSFVIYMNSFVLLQKLDLSSVVHKKRPSPLTMVFLECLGSYIFSYTYVLEIPLKKNFFYDFKNLKKAILSFIV